MQLPRRDALREVRREARAGCNRLYRSGVIGGMLLRRRFAIGDRAFTVLGEPSFDDRSGDWSARLVFIPLDHSLPRSVVSEPLARARKRDEVVHALEGVTDRAIVGAFRSLVLPLPRRTRVR
ncbi:MAG TPA: hypothetical protein VFT57_08110 [Gemmatimonadaceae bacterium]|nr:hypothetical protein [Gemmatimonadaceae bacterium]